MNKKNLTGQIHNAMFQNIQKKGWVAPVDVHVGIGALSKHNLEDWRFGRIPFLEKACEPNLKQLSVIMHEIRAYAEKNNLKSSYTDYHQYGKHKKNKLRFSKSGDDRIEYHYATHFVDVKRVAALKNLLPMNRISNFDVD